MSGNSSTYRGLEFATENGYTVYGQDLFYTTGVSAAPAILAFVLTSQFNLINADIEFISIVTGILLSIILFVYMFIKPASQVPSLVSFPALEMTEEATSSRVEMAIFKNEAEDDSNKFRVRIIGEEDAWEIIGKRHGTRFIPESFHELDTSESVAPPDISEKYDKQVDRILLDVEKLGPRINEDRLRGSWELN